MYINTDYLSRCIDALEKANTHILDYQKDELEYEIFRSAIIKEFEIILEQSGKLLKKILKPYLASAKIADSLYFKDIFRKAGLHSILTVDEVERWLSYRDNRNSSTHDYGKELADKTLELIEAFIADARALVKIIQNANQAEG